MEATGEASERRCQARVSSSLDDETHQCSPEDLIVFEISAAAGEAVTNTFTAPAAGTYQVICKIPGHFSAGMEGLLTVTGAYD